MGVFVSDKITNKKVTLLHNAYVYYSKVGTGTTFEQSKSKFIHNCVLHDDANHLCAISHSYPCVSSTLECIYFNFFRTVRGERQSWCWRIKTKTKLLLSFGLAPPHAIGTVCNVGRAFTCHTAKRKTRRKGGSHYYYDSYWRVGATFNHSKKAQSSFLFLFHGAIVAWEDAINPGRRHCVHCKHGSPKSSRSWDKSVN